MYAECGVVYVLPQTEVVGEVEKRGDRGASCKHHGPECHLLKVRECAVAIYTIKFYDRSAMSACNG